MEKKKREGGSLRGIEVEETLLGWWTLEYVYGLKQRVGADIPGALKNSDIFPSAIPLYWSEHFFSNCFLETNNSGYAKEFIFFRKREREIKVAVALLSGI